MCKLTHNLGLQLLAAVRQKAQENVLLATYAEVFRELAAGGHASWPNYIADEVRSLACSPSALSAPLLLP